MATRRKKRYKMREYIESTYKLRDRSYNIQVEDVYDEDEKKLVVTLEVRNTESNLLPEELLKFIEDFGLDNLKININRETGEFCIFEQFIIHEAP